jgi:hypothetical protein
MDPRKFNIVAVWSPRVGFYFLTLDGCPVSEDGAIVYLDHKSDCERYCKRRFNHNLTRWRAES